MLERVVPERLGTGFRWLLAVQGRVGSVNLIGIFGGLVLGAGIGGVLAQPYGFTAPFWSPSSGPPSSSA